MRRKIKLAYIDNDTARKASFKKRRGGLMKKVRELTILCDVSACIIIYGPGEYDPVAVWPNEEEARSLIRRFQRVPEMEQCKKMVTQESYLRERARKMSNQIRKLLRKNKNTVLDHVMKQIMLDKPLEEIGIGELRGVMWMLEEKVKDVDRRMLYVQYPIQINPCFKMEVTPSAGESLPPPTAEEMTDQRDFSLDAWMFGNASATVQSKLPLPDRNACRDFLGGFQDFGIRYGFGSKGVNEAWNKEVSHGNGNNNHGMGAFFPAGNEVDSGYGYFGGANGNKNKLFDGLGSLDLVDEMDFERNNNREVGIGNTIAPLANNYAMNIQNLGLGFPELGSSICFGNGVNSNINNNDVNFVNMLDYMNARYNAGVQGLALSGVGNFEVNNVNAGTGIEEIDPASESGKNVESGGNAEESNDFNKYIPSFFSPTT